MREMNNQIYVHLLKSILILETWTLDIQEMFEGFLDFT